MFVFALELWAVVCFVLPAVLRKIHTCFQFPSCLSRARAYRLAANQKKASQKTGRFPHLDELFELRRFALPDLRVRTFAFRDLDLQTKARVLVLLGFQMIIKPYS